MRVLHAGDWVRTVREVPITATDQMLGRGGLRAGSRAVVLAVAGRRVTVEADAGWGTVRMVLRRDDCRVVRRAAGAAAFRTTARRLALIRLGVAVALLLPVLHFTAAYLLAVRTTDGLVPALAEAVALGAGDALVAAVEQPGRALVHAIVVTVLWRFAFGSPSRPH